MVPGPVWPPEVNVPCPGPVGVTSTQVSLGVAGVGIEYGLLTTISVGAEIAGVASAGRARVTVSRTRSVCPESASLTV